MRGAHPPARRRRRRRRRGVPGPPPPRQALRGVSRRRRPPAPGGRPPPTAPPRRRRACGRRSPRPCPPRSRRCRSPRGSSTAGGAAGVAPPYPAVSPRTSATGPSRRALPTLSIGRGAPRRRRDGRGARAQGCRRSPFKRARASCAGIASRAARTCPAPLRAARRWLGGPAGPRVPPSRPPSSASEASDSSSAWSSAPTARWSQLRDDGAPRAGRGGGIVIRRRPMAPRRSTRCS